MAVKLFTFNVIILCIFLNVFGLDNAYFSSNDEPLVEIRKINPRINIDKSTRSRATSGCYIRKTVGIHLDLVQREIEVLGLGLKIMDAYRPLSVQRKLWKECPDNRYVANPKHGSRHNRGAAVDVRLVRLHDGKELAMPTTSFSRACHRNYESMQSEEMKKNCKLLELIMEKHGFIPLSTEWWHFDYKDWASYSVLDIAISDLANRDEAMSIKEQQQLSLKKNAPTNKKISIKKRKKKRLPKKKARRRIKNKKQSIGQQHTKRLQGLSTQH